MARFDKILKKKYEKIKDTDDERSGFDVLFKVEKKNC